MNLKLGKRSGRRVKIGLTVLIAAMFIGVASAALLDYYGRIETKATVISAVLLDGDDHTGIASDEFTVIAGNTEYTKHTIENQASVEAKIKFVPSTTVTGLTTYYYLLELQTKDPSTATVDWSGTGHTIGDRDPAHLKTTGTIRDGDEARVHIDMPSGTTLSNIEEISWWEYLVEGYPPHVDIIIETTAGTDALVFEYAYNDRSHYDDEDPMPYGALTGAWYQTFSDDGNGPAVVDDNAYGWLTTGASGPPGGANHYGYTLGEWKAGVTDPVTINGDTIVTAIEIEIDNWGVQSEAYVDDIQIKGPRQRFGFTLSPLTLYGLNIIYNFDVRTYGLVDPGYLYTFTTQIQTVPQP